MVAKRGYHEVTLDRAHYLRRTNMIGFGSANYAAEAEQALVRAVVRLDRSHTTFLREMNGHVAEGAIQRGVGAKLNRSQIAGARWK